MVIAFIETQHVYVQALIYLLGFFIISRLCVFVFERILMKLAKKTETVVDDLIVEAINKPLSFILLLIGIRLAVIPLGLPQSTTDFISLVLVSIILLTVGHIIVRVVDVLLKHWGMAIAKKTKSDTDDTLLGFFHKATQFVIYTFVVLMVLEQWGIQVGPILASLGIAGLAIAFALQPTLSNVFGGIALILDKTIKVGDVIKLSSGEMGSVHDVGIRSTKIKTWDNEIVTVPNGKLVDATIQNFSQPDPSARL